MKKSRRVSNWLMVLVMLVGFVMAGCSASESDRYASTAFTNAAMSEEALVAEDSYPNLAMLLGNPTMNDLYEVANVAIGYLGAMDAQGMTTTEDFKSVMDLLGRLHEKLASYSDNYVPGTYYPTAEGEGEGEEGEGLEEIDLAEYMGLTDAEGNVLPESVAWEMVMKSSGADLQVMVDYVNEVDVYAMIEYIMLADANLLNDALGAIGITGFADASNEEKTKETVLGLVAVVHSLMSKMDWLVGQLEEENGLDGVLDFILGMDVEELGKMLDIVVRDLAEVELTGEQEHGLTDEIIGLVADLIVDALGDALAEGEPASIDMEALKPLLHYLFQPATVQKVNEDGQPLWWYYDDCLIGGETTNPNRPLCAKIDPDQGTNFSLLPTFKIKPVLVETDNAFYRNLKVLLCEITNLNHPAYNTDGEVPLERGAMAFLADVLRNPEIDAEGNPVDTGLYEIRAMLAALYDATDENSANGLWEAISWIVDPECVVWEVLGIDTDVVWPVKVSHILGLRANPGDAYPVLTIPFVQAMFTAPKGYDKAFIEWAIGGLHFDGRDRSDGRTIDMTGLLFELKDLGGKTGNMDPNSEDFHKLLDLLKWVVDGLRYN